MNQPSNPSANRVGQLLEAAERAASKAKEGRPQDGGGSNRASLRAEQLHRQRGAAPSATVMAAATNAARNAKLPDDKTSVVSASASTPTASSAATVTMSMMRSANTVPKLHEKACARLFGEQVGAVGVAQTQPGYGVDEPAYDYERSAPERGRPARASGLLFQAGVAREQTPPQSAKGEAEVVQEQREQVQAQVHAAQVLPGGGPIQVESGGEEEDEGDGYDE